MTGKKLLKRSEAVAWFPDNEPIWVITASLYKKDELEEGLNRATIYVNSLDRLIEAIESAPKENNEVLASVVIFDDLPDDIKKTISSVVEIFSVMPTVKVYEIGRDQLVEGSYEFGSTTELIRQAKGMTRSQYIVELNPDDKQTQVLESLEYDLEISKTKSKDLEKVIQEKNEQIEQLHKDIKDLKAQIDLEIKPREREQSKRIEDLEENLRLTNKELEYSRKESFENQQKASKFERELSDRNYHINALENTREVHLRKIATLEEQLDTLDMEMHENSQHYQELLSTSVDGGRYALIQKELETLKLKNKEQLKEINDLHIRLSELTIQKTDLQNTINTMRKGVTTLEVIGRTLDLDHYRLKNTDLVYIKVVESLPYHRLAVLMLFEELEAHYGKDLVDLVIIKNDEGFDKYIFEGFPLYKNYEETELGVNKYRIHPHTTMFTGLEQYESYVSCLFVVDYIQNDDYLLESLAREEVMTMVRYSKDLKDPRLNLRGKPLSLDDQSIYPLSYDSEIASALIQENRHNVLRLRVKEWFNKLHIA